MDEVLAEINTPDKILSTFTEVMQAGNFPRIPTPAFFYSYFRYGAETLGIGDFQTYFSTAITSGGAILPDENGETLAFGEALARNSEYALQLAAAVIADNGDSLSAAKSVNPVALGKVPVYHYEDYGYTKVDDGYWGQEDFLRVWFATILGLHVPVQDSAKDTWLMTEHFLETLFSVHQHITKPLVNIMNDKTAGLADRQAAYAEFTSTFLQLAGIMQQETPLEAKPVYRLVELIDTRRSLGCRSEVQAAQKTGIAVLGLVLGGDNWAKKGLGDLAEDLAHRQAVFAAGQTNPAAEAGRVTLVPARPLEELAASQDFIISHRHQARLKEPVRDCVNRFTSQVRVKQEPGRTAEDVNMMKALVQNFEFLNRRPQAYDPEVVRKILSWMPLS